MSRTTFFGHDVSLRLDSRTPEVCSISLWHACNLSCRHCYSNSGPGQKRLGDATTPGWEDVIEQLVGVGCRVVSFTGGEPLLCPDRLLQLAAYAKSRGIQVGLSTNGTLMTPRIAGKLAEIGATVSVDIDGMEQRHDYFRGEGVFRRAKGAIKKLVDAGVPTFVLTTMMRSNFEDLDEIFGLADHLGVRQCTLNELKPYGRGLGLYESEKLRASELIQVYDMILKRLELNEFPVWFLCQGPLYAYVRRRCPSLSSVVATMPSAHCKAGRNKLFVSPNGEVKICAFLPASVGNLCSQSLEQLWHENQLIKKLQERDFEGACGRCSDKYVCGGCRSRALYLRGSIFSEDPICTSFEDCL